MPSFLRHSWRIRRLEASRDKVRRAYACDRLALQRQKPAGNEIEELNASARFEDDTIQHEIDAETTSYLLARARQLMVEVPSHENGEYWDEPDLGYSAPTLSTKGINFVRGKIRAELKDRHELFIRWATIAIGLIGAIIGLVSVFRNHR